MHVSSVLRGRRRINIPNGDTVVFPGDRIEAIGDDEQLGQLQQALGTEVVPDDPDIEKREMRLRRFVLSGSCPFVGKTLRESGIRDRYNCMVVGVEEGQERLTMIAPGRRFERGDMVWVVGEADHLKALGEVI